MTLNPAKDPSCVLAFDWGEGSGNTVYDLSGHGNNGTIYGATRTRGILRFAGSFDGVDDIVKIPNSDTYRAMSEITICSWVMPQVYKPPPYYPDIVYYPGGTRLEYRVGRAYSFGVVNEAGTWVYTFYALSELPKGGYHLWSFVVGRYSAVEERVDLFVNGEIVSSVTQTGNIAWSTTEDLTVGGGGMKQLIGSVRIYNRVLSEKEIREHYYYGKKIFSQPEMFYHRKISPVLSTKATELAREVA